MGETVSIARQDHVCAALTNRLGLATSVCSNITDKTTATAVTYNVPLDGYLAAPRRRRSRRRDPVLPGRDRIALRVRGWPDHRQDQQPLRQQQEGRRDHRLRGEHHGHHLGDPSSGAVTQLLTEHYDAAVTAGATATDALKSTFIIACLSPTSVAIGL